MRRSLSIFPALALGLMACSGINDSWEVKGGGYIKYKINDGKSRTVELAPDDVEVPFIRNSHHYLYVKTQIEESSDGDQLAFIVNNPVLGDNHPVQGQYSWFIAENSEKGSLDGGRSTVHFDQKDDSTWTANLDLYATDCRSGHCVDTLPALHITGRLRYWIPKEDR